MVDFCELDAQKTGNPLETSIFDATTLSLAMSVCGFGHFPNLTFARSCGIVVGVVLGVCSFHHKNRVFKDLTPMK